MTNAELAVLTLVAEQPRHGYEIEQVIEERGMREWTEVGFSSIYYLLKKLEQAGWVQARLEETAHGPARKVYRTTPAGEAALHAALIEALSVPQPCYSPLLLGIGNLPGVSSREALAALRQHHAALLERLGHVQARRAAQQPLPYFVDAMFDYSAVLLRAQIAWIERFVAQIEDVNSPDKE